ncbi:MAG: hypothetical protein WD037_10225 [Balneolales bacterium]
MGEQLFKYCRVEDKPFVDISGDQILDLQVLSTDALAQVIQQKLLEGFGIQLALVHHLAFVGRRLGFYNHPNRTSTLFAVMDHQIRAAFRVDGILRRVIGFSEEPRHQILMELLGFTFIDLVQQARKVTLKLLNLRPPRLGLQKSLVQRLAWRKNHRFLLRNIILNLIFRHTCEWVAGERCFLS